MLLADNLQRLGTETAFEVLARAGELQRLLMRLETTLDQTGC